MSSLCWTFVAHAPRDTNNSVIQREYILYLQWAPIGISAGEHRAAVGQALRDVTNAADVGERHIQRNTGFGAQMPGKSVSTPCSARSHEYELTGNPARLLRPSNDRRRAFGGRGL